ncbi:MAG: hypothetical protein ACP5HH_07365 [Fervidicoccaceae archaeon]
MSEKEINEMVEELKTEKKEEQKKEQETVIKVNIEQRWSPILRVTHEDYAIRWGIPFNVEVNEVRKDGIVNLELFGDYYIKKPLNANMRKSLYYHIFRLKKPFFIIVPKYEMQSRSGSHKILNNVDLEEKQPFEAKLKEFIKFPPFAGLYPKDLEELDKAGEKYISLVHYNLLFTFENIERYNWNKIEFNLPCSCEDVGIARFKGEIPFKPVQRAKLYDIEVVGDKPFKLLKGNAFFIAYNNNNETIELTFKKGEEIINRRKVPSEKAYYYLDYHRI